MGIRPHGESPRPEDTRGCGTASIRGGNHPYGTKTFIGNLYKQVKDPNLIASMSGHSEGSRAFVRYRKIDDDMKKELVNLLD